MSTLYLKKQDLWEFFLADKIVIAKEIGNSLSVSSEDEFEKFLQVLSQLKREHHNVVRFYTATAYDIDFAEYYNEIPIPELLLQHMGIEIDEEIEIYIWKIGYNEQVFLSKSKSDMQQGIEYKIKQGESLDTLKYSTCKLVEKAEF